MRHHACASDDEPAEDRRWLLHLQALHMSSMHDSAESLQMTCVFRVALHLQLLAVSQPHHEQQGMADTTALSFMARADDSVRSRQSSAERDVYAEQQRAATAAASCGAGLAAAAEDAVVTSCEVVQKLLQQLEELGTSGVVELTTQVHIVHVCLHVCVCVRMRVCACEHVHACMCVCVCARARVCASMCMHVFVPTRLVNVHTLCRAYQAYLNPPSPAPSS